MRAGASAYGHHRQLHAAVTGREIAWISFGDGNYGEKSAGFLFVGEVPPHGGPEASAVLGIEP